MIGRRPDTSGRASPRFVRARGSTHLLGVWPLKRLGAAFLIGVAGVTNGPALAADWQIVGADTTVRAGAEALRPADVRATADGIDNVLPLAEDFSGERDGIGITGFSADRLTGNHAFFALSRPTDTARAGDVIRCPLDAGTCTLEFLAETAGIPDGVGVSAVGVEVVSGVQRLLLSFDTSFELDGQVYRPADLARFDGSDLSMALSHTQTGAEPFWNLTAVARRPDGSWNLAFGNGGALDTLQFFTSDVLAAGADGSVGGRLVRLRTDDLSWEAAGVAAWDRLATGRVGFASLAPGINPGQSEVVLSVERKGGAESRIEVDYTTVDGTAVAGTDYQATSGTLVWEHGETGTRDLAVTILNTDGSASDLDFGLRLSRSSAWSLTGSPAAVTLTIPNEDTLFNDSFEG